MFTTDRVIHVSQQSWVHCITPAKRPIWFRDKGWLAAGVIARPITTQDTSRLEVKPKIRQIMHSDWKVKPRGRIHKAQKVNTTKKSGFSLSSSSNCFFFRLLENNLSRVIQNWICKLPCYSLKIVMLSGCVVIQFQSFPFFLTSVLF